MSMLAWIFSYLSKIRYKTSFSGPAVLVSANFANSQEVIQKARHHTGGRTGDIKCKKRPTPDKWLTGLKTRREFDGVEGGKGRRRPG